MIIYVITTKLLGNVMCPVIVALVTLVEHLTLTILSAPMEIEPSFAGENGTYERSNIFTLPNIAVLNFTFDGSKITLLVEFPPVRDIPVQFIPITTHAIL